MRDFLGRHEQPSAHPRERPTADQSKDSPEAQLGEFIGIRSAAEGLLAGAGIIRKQMREQLGDNWKADASPESPLLHTG